MFLFLKKNEFLSWLLVVVFFLLGLFVFYYFNDQILVFRYFFLFLFLFFSFLFFFKTSFGVNCFIYYNESKVEFKKIIWPNRKETVYIAGIVALIIFLLFCFLNIVDYFLVKIVVKIIGYNND